MAAVRAKPERERRSEPPSAPMPVTWGRSEMTRTHAPHPLVFLTLAILIGLVWAWGVRFWGLEP